MAEDSIQVFVSSAVGWPAQSLRGKAIKKTLGRTSGPRSWDRRLSLRSVVAPQGFFNYFARAFLRKVYLVSSEYVPIAQTSNKHFEEKPVVVDSPFSWKGSVNGYQLHRLLRQEFSEQPFSHQPTGHILYDWKKKSSERPNIFPSFFSDDLLKSFLWDGWHQNRKFVWRLHMVLW